VKNAAKPLSPTVIDFEIEGWLIWNLSEGQAGNNHSRRRRDLIKINFGQLKRAGSTVLFYTQNFSSLALASGQPFRKIRSPRKRTRCASEPI
jgi:hypothetical protein